MTVKLWKRLSIDMALDPYPIASAWSTALSSAFASVDVDALEGLFLPGGWLRDLLVFTWDVRAFEGYKKIRSFMSTALARAQISCIKLDSSSYLKPHEAFIGQLQSADIEFAFDFDCGHGYGRGYAVLLKDERGTWKALSVLFMLSDLVGHEEIRTLYLRDDLTGEPGRDMQNDFTRWVSDVERKPHVLIIGGAQTGLHMAARFKQMRIPTLVIERTARVGDGWRQRYPSLTLHTPKRHHTLLYQSYPSNWPEYTPRDKLANWLESYATTQDLVVWTNTELQPRPQYNPQTREWDVTVIRDGKPVMLRPAHIILATGTLGKTNIPYIPSRDAFCGTVLHSSQFEGPAKFVGQRVVVVGAGNSSIDICQDLVLHGAESVTMVQRSSTCVMHRDFMSGLLREAWPEDVPIEVSDLRWAGMGFGLRKKLMMMAQDFVWSAQKEMYDKLRKGGVQLNMGPEGEGLYILSLGRLGGFWQDKGGADLIADGKIKVRSGVSLDHFTENGITLSDGTGLSADTVILATGFLQIRESSRELLGDDVIDQIGPVYGLDDEGELHGSYRPSGHPGLWFATGDFFASRFMGKVLALQLKAAELGLIGKE